MMQKKILLISPCSQDSHQYNGDYYFSLSLMHAFIDKGYDVDFRFVERWYDQYDGDIVFVIRGPFKYVCNPSKKNYMWIISHPFDVELDEYKQYQWIFVASSQWVESLRKIFIKYGISCGLSLAYPCSDKKLFFSKANYNCNNRLLFVGINHTEGRKVISQLFPFKFDLDIYGGGWDKSYACLSCKGDGIENAELKTYYNITGIVLNDTRKEMLDCGFVTNRPFDVFMSGGFVLSEKCNALYEIFDDSVALYDGTKQDLEEKINYYLYNKKIRYEMIESGQKIVLEKHTFENRVAFFAQFFDD